jgi:uncharacterized protein (DUF1697 family)
MKDLKALFEELKYTSVATYIQSGNVVFKAAENTTDIATAKKTEAAIKEKFGVDVPVIIRTAEEMGHAVKTNPFIGREGIDIEKLHITFLEELPAAANLEKIKTYDYPPEQFIIIQKEVYLYCPNGYGNAKLVNSFFENKLKVKATTRNWKTVNKLVEMCQV